MNNTLLIMSLALATLFVTLSHPISMGAALLVQTIIISLIIGPMSVNFWFSYILFLIMVGGMLVLFIYMTSIASNEKFTLNLKSSILILTSMILPILHTNLTSQMSTGNQESTIMDTTMLFNQLLLKFMNFPGMFLLLFMMIYLLITLIASVKITNISHGPLRMSN